MTEGELRVFFVSPAYPPPWGGLQRMTLELPPLLEHMVDVRVGVAHGNSLWSAIRLALNVVGQIAVWRPHIVHALTWRVAAPAALLPRRIRGRLIVHAHGSEIARVGRFTRVLRNAVFRRADVVIAVSAFTARRVAEEVRPGAVVIPNGVTIGPDARAERPHGGPFHVVTVGRFVERKGHRRLLDVCAAVRETGVDLRWTVIGDGPLRPGLEQAIANAGYTTWASVRTEVSDAELAEAYATADAFCLLPAEVGSDAEGFGLVYLEASAHGLPVVATGTGGVRDAVVDGETGVIVADDRGAISALSTLASDAALRSRLGRAGIERARSMSWERRARQLVEIYSAGFTRTAR